MKDVYVEEISRAFITDGVVCLVGQVRRDESDPLGPSAPEEVVRLRIPIARYQRFVSNARDFLVQAMKDGWFGESGRKAAEALPKEESK